MSLLRQRGRAISLLVLALVLVVVGMSTGQSVKNPDTLVVVRKQAGRRTQIRPCVADDSTSGSVWDNAD